MKSEKILAKMAMIEKGILPAATGRELKSMLESLPDKEQRKFKRKFRKVWRKLAKNSTKSANILKLGERDPTRSIKATRSAFVWSSTVRDVFKES